MGDFRYAAIAALLKGMHATGVDRLAAPFLRGRGVILTLHHVVETPEQLFQPNRILEISAEFLDAVLTLLKARGYDLACLDEVPQRLTQDGPPFALLTFDDGYRDNVTHALPVLEKQGAPFTMYVTTGFAEATAPLWWRDLEEAVRLADVLEVPFPQGAETIRCGTADEKRSAFNLIYWRLRHGPEEALRRGIDALARRQGIDPLARTKTLCMRWHDIRALAQNPLCTIGAHTLTHPMLAKHDANMARREMVESATIIEHELGSHVRHISYPVGDPTSAGPREFDLAKEAGFETAVTTRPGVLFPEHAHHLHALPRISLNGLFQSVGETSSLLSGLPTALQNRFRKLNVA